MTGKYDMNSRSWKEISYIAESLEIAPDITMQKDENMESSLKAYTHEELGEMSELYNRRDFGTYEKEIIPITPKYVIEHIDYDFEDPTLLSALWDNGLVQGLKKLIKPEVVDDDGF